jgi:type II secretory pathway pseudopilin PulG
MKENKGITLIALIVTIIVLIILAGVAIAMLRGDNGILSRASEAKYENEIAAFTEQVKLAQMALRTDITANMVNEEGYIATEKTKNFQALVNGVRRDIGIANDNKTFQKENFSVQGYLDQEGTSSVDGVGYILITYTSNALRSSLPGKNATNKVEGVASWTCNGVTFYAPTNAGIKSANQAVLAYVIKVTNYNCELSEAIITDTETVAGTNADGTAGDWAVSGLFQSAATFTASKFTAVTLESTSTATTKF